MAETQTIVHLVRSSQVQEILYTIEKEINAENSSPWVMKKIDSLKSKIAILSVHRQKRGLFNIIGKGSKYLFGTMDEEDGQIITEQIEKLEQTNKDVVQNVNQQIRINDFFNETLNLLSQNQNKISQKYLNLSGNTKNLMKYQETLEITLKLQVLENKIDQLLDNIASIKMGILHPGILTSEEIKEFNVTIEKLENARTGILRTENDRLLITIKIPTKFIQTPYKLLFPIPNKDFHEISEEPQMFIELDNIKYVMENKIMYKNELKRVQTCLNTECPIRINKNEEIVKLNSNTILGINLNKPEIVNYCNGKKLEMIGNYIINIQNCSLIINNVTYRHFSKEYEDRNIFELFERNWDNENSTVQKVVMRHIDNLKEIKEIKFHRNVNFALNGVTVFIIVLAIITLVYIIMSQQRKTYIVNKEIVQETKQSLTQESKRNLKEGGVMIEDPKPTYPKPLPPLFPSLSSIQVY